ncbi:TPA: hypothetical protein DIC40_03295 [Patescibacteria group bacterium]|nr:hypothetical protein P148_SR1C00001G0402 [candidate division SR1 bacterium RAAC1_SR1_1]HCY20867.1 hypothetical protein [Candidatus Gracilibacteria bacterium]
MKEKLKNIGQSIGDWLADEGYSPSKQEEIIHLVKRNEGRCIELTELMTEELKQMIEETLDSVESEEYTILDLIEGENN